MRMNTLEFPLNENMKLRLSKVDGIRGKIVVELDCDRALWGERVLTFDGDWGM